MMVIDPLTGKKADFTSKKTIIEVFKKNIDNNDDNVQSMNINNRLKNNNILRFY